MPTVLLNETMLHAYRAEQKELQDRCSSFGRPDYHDERDSTDRNTNGDRLHSSLPTAQIMSRARSSLMDVNAILSNYSLVTEPTNTDYLQIGHIATFKNFDAPKGSRPRRYRIGAYGQIYSKSVPPTIGYEKIEPFLNQKLHHDARIMFGPMEGEWELIKIELQPLILAAANAA